MTESLWWDAAIIFGTMLGGGVGIFLAMVALATFKKRVQRKKRERK